MKEIITVFTGEVKTGDATVVLKSGPVGSCVVVVLFDEKSKTGGMAHIMLPGKAPETANVIPGRYAANAIGMLINELTARGLNPERLKAVVAGGGNVLKRANDTIGAGNLASVKRLLKEYKIEVVAESVKGTERKTVRFDTGHGIIFYTKGDDPEKVLYRILKEPQMLTDSQHETA
ncbi:MAG: chemotaxis protein CheD [Tangfeifania sp.]